MPGESVRDDGLSAIEEIKRIMNEIANTLKTELSERSFEGSLTNFLS